MVFIGIIGGLAIFIYGLQQAREGLQHIAGERLRHLLHTLTENRLMGMLVGIIITAIIQSSSATTVMLVGFASTGMLTLSQAAGLLLGADIGTTLTVQLISFNIYQYCLLIVGVGFALRYFTRGHTSRYSGQIIMGFGFIFLGMRIMSEATSPLRDSQIFIQLLQYFGHNPVGAILVSAALTGILQTSAATIGLLLSLSLSMPQLVTLEVAIPFVLGANIGTCITALLASIGSNVQGKRVAIAHLLFKVIGVVLILPLLKPFIYLVTQTAHELPHQIANSHTLFNVGISFVFLPFTRRGVTLINRLIIDRGEAKGVFRVKYLDPHSLDTPSLAFAQAIREILRMAEIVQGMYLQSLMVFKKSDSDLIEKIETTDDEVDFLDRSIKLYLTRISQKSLTSTQAKREQELLTFTFDLECIGDIIDKNVMELAKKKMKKNLIFSPEGFSQLEEFHQKIYENFELAISAFTNEDRELSFRLLRKKGNIINLEEKLRNDHINRLRQGLKESIETSSIHLDLLTNFLRINHHLTNIAHPILQEKD